jgi:hypothetical protein
MPRGTGERQLRQVLLVPQSTPLFPAAVLNLKTRAVSELKVPGQGEATVIGFAKGGDRNYYLIASGDGTSQVFARDTNSADAGLMQLTTIPSLKLGLSADSVSGTVAFTSYEDGVATGTIMALMRATTTPIALGAGKNPTVLSGGLLIVYERDGTLYAANPPQPNDAPILRIPEGGSYAIDGRSLRVVLHDPATRSLQFFRLREFGGASAEYTTPAPSAAPNLLLALHDRSIATLVAGSEGLFTLTNSKKGTLTLIPGSAVYLNAVLHPHD